MTVKITKPALNLREELNSLKQPAGLSALMEKIGAVSNRIQVSSDMTVAGTATFTDSIDMAYSSGNNFKLLCNNTGFGTLDIATNDQTSGTDKYINIGRNTGSGQGMSTFITMGDDSDDSYTKVIGELQVTGSLLVPEKIEHTSDINTYLQFNLSDSWRVVTGGEERLKANNGEVVINDNSSNMDFRVESDSNTNMLWVDASRNGVGVGTSSVFEHQQGSAIDMSYDGTIWAGNTWWAGGLRTGTTFYTTTAGDKYKHSNRQAVQHYQNSQGGSHHFYSATGGTAGNVISWQEMAEFDRDEVVFNNGGVDQDFRVESDTLSYAFFIDSSSNRAGVGTGTPNASLGIKKNVSNVADVNPVVRLQSATAGDELLIRAQGLDDSSVNRYADIAFLGSNTNEKIEFRAPYNTTSPQLILDSANGVIMNEGGLSTRDFRVESDSNTHMLTVDAGADYVGINRSDSDGVASLSIKNKTNGHATAITSENSIAGSGEKAQFAEGTIAVDTVSSGNTLSIPIFSQGNKWERYTIEMMFVSAEYNSSGSSNNGTLSLSLASLTTLNTVTELHKTGNVSGVTKTGMNLQITFTSAYTGGLNNYEGVLVYYKILGTRARFIEMWNATLN